MLGITLQLAAEYATTLFIARVFRGAGIPVLARSAGAGKDGQVAGAAIRVAGRNKTIVRTAILASHFCSQTLPEATPVLHCAGVSVIAGCPLGNQGKETLSALLVARLEGAGVAIITDYGFSRTLSFLCAPVV